MFRDKGITVIQEKTACRDTITQTLSSRKLVSLVRQLHTGQKGNLLLAMHTKYSTNKSPVIRNDIMTQIWRPYDVNFLALLHALP